MDAPAEIYHASAVGANSRLRQGEILSEIVQLCLDLATFHDETKTVLPVTHPFAVILTQDCDLDQDFKARSGSNKPDKLIPSVLFCQVFAAEELSRTVGGSDIWKRVRQNKDERYQFLQKVEPACDALRTGLPELTIDFKRCFTMPTDEVYKRVEVNEAKRRCFLVGPYLEHLSSRFAYFIGRVALPQDHFSEPVSGGR